MYKNNRQKNSLSFFILSNERASPVQIHFINLLNRLGKQEKQASDVTLCSVSLVSLVDVFITHQWRQNDYQIVQFGRDYC